MARRRFFVDSVSGGRAVAGPAAAEHLARVLRAQPGQQVEVAHGGRAWLARILEVSPREVGFELLAELPHAAAAELEVAVALFKFDRFEWMLEKATELGVHRLHLLATRRTDPRLIEAASKRLQRWRTLLTGAAEQSRRAEVPEISFPQPLPTFLARPFSGVRLLLSEAPGAAPFPPSAPPLVLLAGPEGGWAPDELAAAAAGGFAPVSLGPRILRCETAVLAALARLGGF